MSGDAFPYAGIAGSQIWNSAAATAWHGPGGTSTPPKFTLELGDRIASAGSCFAQELSAHLRRRGLNYLRTEPDSGDLSARYGNIYTARQLLQLLQRSIGAFTPMESAWPTDDGAFVDPFRPTVSRAATIAEIESERARHLTAVRAMFEQCDVFVFTLGLTERWSDARDGAVFPTCPGRGRGVFRHDLYRWTNGDVAEAVDALDRFIHLLESVNPRARVILTVSPVPISATLLRMDVIRASVLCKSTLKVAAETVAARHDRVDYFPSYELATQADPSVIRFESDGRSVRRETVDEVSRFFVRRFYDGEHVAMPAAISAPRETRPPSDEASTKRLCDEDELLAAIEAELSVRPATSLAAGEGRPEPDQAISPVYFVGDSNVLVFRDRVLTDWPSPTTTRIGRVLYTPGLHAYDFTSRDGSLNRTLLGALVSELLLIADGRGGFTAFRPRINASLDYAMRMAGGPHAGAPTIVLSCGMLDVGRFLEVIECAEIELPADFPRSGTPAPSAKTISFEEACAYARVHLEPFERGLRALADAGLEGCFVLSLPPPTRNDDAYANAIVRASTRARYHAYALMNRLLAEICARTGSRFVNTWNAVLAADGLRDDAYGLDSVHANVAATPAIVRELARWS